MKMRTFAEGKSDLNESTERKSKARSKGRTSDDRQWRIYRQR